MPTAPCFRLAAAMLATTVLAAGCAHVRTAQMALPAALQGAEAVPLQGLDGPRQGTLQVGAQQGRFERSASQLALFERSGSLGLGSASGSYTLPGDTGSDTARCRGREVEAARQVAGGVLAGALKPLAWTCQWADGATLTLTAQRLGSALGTRDEREGRYEHQGLVLDLRSVHALQGSPLPVAEPAGYLVQHQGTPVAAVELTDRTPLLRRPAAGQPLHQAATRAGIALALLWTPPRL